MIEYDDEDDCLLTPAFPVTDLSNVDTSKPPSSGMEYLQHVRLESKKCPAVVVAKLDMKKLNSKQTVKYSGNNGFTPAPPGLAPDEKLQNEQVVSFSALRVELSQKKKQIKDQLPPACFPDVSDRLGWCEYCLGTEVKRKVQEQMFKKKGAGSSAASGSSPGGASGGNPPKSAKEEIQEGHDPLLSVMLHLPHSTIEKLLAYHVSWLQITGFSEKQGRWIFSLLALLEKPLRPTTCDLLRRLARICAAQRATLTNEMDDNLIGLNHIICLVSRYFDQKDMSDNYAEKCVGLLLGRTLDVNENDEHEYSGSEDEEEDDDED